MENIEKNFKKVERQIQIGQKNGYSVKGLLKEKVRLLKLGYQKLSDAMQDGSLRPIAPVFAREFAFLNNIKNIEEELNINTEDTENEIQKIKTQMREHGFGWLLDNMPERKE